MRKTVKPELARLEAPLADEYAEMTFPIYRSLLSLVPGPRHPEQNDTKVVQPIAVGAQIQDSPVGLALAEIPLSDDERMPELLSVYVQPAVRNQGIATDLVERVEQVARAAAFDRLAAVYMTGKPSTASLERVLEKRGWETPETRTVTIRFTPEQALSMPWFGRVRLPSPEYEIFPWVELRRQERVELERSQAESPWIPTGLEPWRHDVYGFDEASSLGLRHRGRVAGWVINHRVSSAVVRFTCSFMRKDLGRRGRILPLYSASILALRESGCRHCIFVTPVGYSSMVEFIKRRGAPWAEFFAETRGSTKVLASSEMEAAG